MVRGMLTGHVMEAVGQEMFSGVQGRALVDEALANIDAINLPTDQRETLRTLLQSVQRFNQTGGGFGTQGLMTVPYTVNENAVTSGANAAPAIGTATASMAAVMTRLRPSTSATAPVNGAVRAMASALAVMMVLISAAPTPNSRASAGSSACGEYRLRKAQKPAVAMATLRGSKCIAAV